MSSLVRALDAASSDRFTDVLYETLAEPLALRHAWLYLLDYSENHMRSAPTMHAPAPPPGPVSVRDSALGKALTTRTVQACDDPEHGRLLLIPVSQRGEAV